MVHMPRKRESPTGGASFHCRGGIVEQPKGTNNIVLFRNRHVVGLLFRVRGGQNSDLSLKRRMTLSFKTFWGLLRFFDQLFFFLVET